MMDIEFFIHTLAWIAAVICGGLVVLRASYWWWYNYTPAGEMEQRLDILRGQRGIFPMKWPAITFVVAVVALLSF
jgi:hypothetical protein